MGMKGFAHTALPSVERCDAAHSVTDDGDRLDPTPFVSVLAHSVASLRCLTKPTDPSPARRGPN